MPLIQRRRPSPPPLPTEDQQEEETSIPETVLLETSYDEAFGSSQTEVSNLPFALPEFPLLGNGMVSSPPLLDELTDSDSSFNSSFSSQDFTEVLSKIHDTADSDIEVRLDDGDSFYTAIMTRQSSTNSLQDPEKKVRFSLAEIREYNVIVGDHPGCATGLPLALDWNYHPNIQTVDLRDTPSPMTATKRPAQRLSLLQRIKWLKQFYQSSEDLWMAERERRQALEEEGIDEGSPLERVPTRANLCDCHHDIAARQVVQPSDVCQVMQCLVDL